MASWQYKYLFPAPGHPLQPADAIHILCFRGLSFDDTVRLMVKIDDEGHVLDTGDESRLEDPKLNDLRGRLRRGEQFSIQCRNSEIVISCLFATHSSNPHIFFGWPRNLFCKLSDAVQNEYLGMIRDFSKACGAAYVILLDDAPDQFEDRFLEIDGVRFLDIEVSHSYGHGIQSVWIDSGAGAALPEGAALRRGNYVGDGFTEYVVAVG